MQKLKENSGFITGTLLGAGALILYMVTMAPDIGAHDIAEWQATGITLGIAHGPGSPAYTILSYLLSLVPLGAPAARVTFVSVAMGAGGVVAVYVFVLMLLQRILPALIAALTLALAGVWWANASVAGPYNAVVLTMAVLLILLLLWSREGNMRFLWIAALLAGAALAYHPLAMFFLPIPVAGVFLLGPWRQLLSPRNLSILASLFIAGLSIYLYLPLRSSTEPVVQYAKIDSVSSFFNHVSASQARGANLRETFFPTPEEIGERLDEVVGNSYASSFIIFSLIPLGLLFVPGVARQMGRRWRWAGLLTGGMLVQMLLIFLFSDIYAHYYLPFLFYFSVGTGFSIYTVMMFLKTFSQNRTHNEIAAHAIGALYILLLATGLPHAWAFADHSNDHYLRRYIEDTFKKAEPGAVVMGTWETIEGFKYVQTVEGKRRDIRLITLPDAEQESMLAELRKQEPERQLLVSRALNIRNRNDLRQYASSYPLSHKALTYPDFLHGEPYPWAARLFEYTDQGLAKVER